MKSILCLIVLGWQLSALNVYAATENSDTDAQSLRDKQLQFFQNLSQLCGKAFVGKVAIDTENSETLRDKPIVLHVRKCSSSQLQMPLHIGDDSSRTLLISKTSEGLQLQHDHRYPDGKSHTASMYGGHTTSKGEATLQSFPVDDFSKTLFLQTELKSSVNNVWQIGVTNKMLSYRLTRPSREVVIEFDLANLHPTPKAPWGYSED